MTKKSGDSTLFVVIAHRSYLNNKIIVTTISSNDVITSAWIAAAVTATENILTILVTILCWIMTRMTVDRTPQEVFGRIVLLCTVLPRKRGKCKPSNLTISLDIRGLYHHHTHRTQTRSSLPFRPPPPHSRSSSKIMIQENKWYWVAGNTFCLAFPSWCYAILRFGGRLWRFGVLELMLCFGSAVVIGSPAFFASVFPSWHYALLRRPSSVWSSRVDAMLRFGAVVGSDDAAEYVWLWDLLKMSIDKDEKNDSGNTMIILTEHNPTFSLPAQLQFILFHYDL